MKKYFSLDFIVTENNFYKKLQTTITIQRF